MDKAREICKEMLHQRKYKIIKEDKNIINVEQPDKTNLVVMFCDKIEKFNIRTLKHYISELNNMDVNHAIIIHDSIITSYTKKFLEEKHIDITLELFHIDDLQYNITKHILQPQFRKLSTKESSEFKVKHTSRLPRMYLDDPIARFYNYSSGDIIEITRRDTSVIYRIVN